MKTAFFRYLPSAMTVEKSIGYIEIFSKDRRKDQFLGYAYENFVNCRSFRRIQTLLLLARNREKFVERAIDGEQARERWFETRWQGNGVPWLLSALDGGSSARQDKERTQEIPGRATRLRFRRYHAPYRSSRKTWFNAHYLSLCIYFLLGYFDSPNYLFRFRS